MGARRADGIYREPGALPAGARGRCRVRAAALIVK